MNALDEQVIFVNGIAYNSRGFRVCGAPNQRGGFCARFGYCPFHKERQTTLQQTKVSEYPQASFTFKETPTLNNERKFKHAWKLDEHQRFLIALKKFGHGNWIQIAEYVGTRNASQCQSHAQKYYLRKRKLESNASLKRSIFDLIDENTLSVQVSLEEQEEAIPKVFQSCDSTGAPMKFRASDSISHESLTSCPAEANLFRDISELSKLHSCKRHSFPIKIFRNGEFQHGVQLELPDSLAAFFMKAAQLLNMSVATKAYTRSGFEISSLHEICPGDILWISSGEDFICPSPEYDMEVT